MPNVLRFTVPGPPIPKARARVVRSAGKVRSFTPATTAEYERRVALCARAAMARMAPDWTADAVSYRLTAVFYMPTRRRCDWDNLAKAIADSLNGIAWADDSAIVEAHVWKRYDPVNPRAEVEVEAIGAAPAERQGRKAAA